MSSSLEIKRSLITESGSATLRECTKQDGRTNPQWLSQRKCSAILICFSHYVTRSQLCGEYQPQST